MKQPLANKKQLYISYLSNNDDGKNREAMLKKDVEAYIFALNKLKDSFFTIVNRNNISHEPSEKRNSFGNAFLSHLNESTNKNVETYLKQIENLKLLLRTKPLS